MRIHLNVGHLSHKPRYYLAVVLLVISNIFLLSLVPFAGKTGDTSAINTPPEHVQIYSGSNAVTGGMFEISQNIGKMLSNFSASTGNTLQVVSSTIANTGQVVGSTIYNGTLAVAHGVVDGIAFVVRLPSNLAQSTTNAAVVSGVIRPSNNAAIPVIDDASLLTAQAAAAKAPSAEPPAPADDEAAWPIHGDITTLFGVPHWPYQPTHSGLDISDGRAAGSTPIRPYRPGKVVDVVHSNSGLGNHVIVDHGSGITSVYGHLASIAVQIGQSINKETVLGTEGSTGASTGTHLHFEIRLNGQAVDPRAHIKQPL